MLQFLFRFFSALHFYSMIWKHEKQTSSFAKMLVLLNGNGSARYGRLSIYVEYGKLIIAFS